MPVDMKGSSIWYLCFNKDVLIIVSFNDHYEHVYLLKSHERVGRWLSEINELCPTSRNNEDCNSQYSCTVGCYQVVYLWLVLLNTCLYTQTIRHLNLLIENRYAINADSISRQIWNPLASPIALKAWIMATARGVVGLMRVNGSHEAKPGEAVLDNFTIFQWDDDEAVPRCMYL